MTVEEFFASIEKWIAADKKDWNHVTLMAYFCHKYEEKNKVRFRLTKWNETPNKNKEGKDFITLIKTFLPENWEKMDDLILKKKLREEAIYKCYNYINWMFDYKFRSGEKSVTGTKIFLLPSMIVEFERMYAAVLKKTESTNKFEDFIKEIKEKYPEIFEMHQLESAADLPMIRRYALSYSLDDDSIELKVLKLANKYGL